MPFDRLVAIPAARRLAARVTALLRAPAAEWWVIARERATPRSLVTGYIVPLASIGAIALFVSDVAFGEPVPLIGRVRADPATALASVLLLLAFTVIAVLGVAALVDALAPHFGGRRDRLGALKLATYSHTPFWLAGVTNVLPGLRALLILGAVYGVYLAFTGLPVLMRCERPRTLRYALVAGACATLLFTAFSALVTLATGLGPDLL
ncbi:MAG: Yip1 family protein [Burkholderiales bacterium]